MTSDDAPVIAKNDPPSTVLSSPTSRLYVRALSMFSSIDFEILYDILCRIVLDTLIQNSLKPVKHPYSENVNKKVSVQTRTILCYGIE